MTAVVRGSIRGRLLLLLLGAAAVLAVLLYFAVQSIARQVAQQSQDDILSASARSVIDSARSVDGEITVDLPYAALSMLDSVTDERVFYAIRLGEEVLTGYPALPRPALTDRQGAAHMSASFLGENIRIASVYRPVSTDLGRDRLEVSVAQTLSGQRQTLARASRLALALGLAFFALSTGLAVLIARATMQPLDRLTASISRRGGTDLRPVSTPVPREMSPLVASLNSLMTRLGASLDRSEDFIAEAAHRVRTPLALVRTRAEIIERNVQKVENRQAIREMIQAIDESSRTAGQLLDHAMVSFRLDSLAQQPVALDALMSETVEQLRPVFEIRSIILRVSERVPVRVQADPILIQNALRNLLDNALKYSPAGSEISVLLSKNDLEAKLEVRDTGPGFPKGSAEALVGRFVRGDNTEGIIGSGLGLTIVRDIIEAHGGRLALETAEGGGACAILYLPVS